MGLFTAVCATPASLRRKSIRKRAITPRNHEACYNYTVFCENISERLDFAKWLQPFMPSGIDFSVHKPIKKDEQRTHWALFAGPGNKTEIEPLYSLIDEWETSRKCSCCKHLTKRMRRWNNTANHVFHLSIRCDPQMVTMVELLYEISDAKSIPWQHDLMNAAGEPIVHIATRMGKLEMVKHLLSQRLGAINAKGGASACTLLYAVARTEHRSIIQYLMSRDRTPQINYDARNICGFSPLEHAINLSFPIATCIYDLMPRQDGSYVDGYSLLWRIIVNGQHTVDDKMRLAKRIIGGLTSLPTNTSSSVYNVSLDYYRDRDRGV